MNQVAPYIKIRSRWWRRHSREVKPFHLPFGNLNGRLPGMSTVVQIDQAGRVVLPKKLRERFRLRGGDTLSLEIKGDAIELRPQKSKARLERVNGVLVLTANLEITEGRDLVSEFRDERIDEIARAATGKE